MKTLVLTHYYRYYIVFMVISSFMVIPTILNAQKQVESSIPTIHLFTIKQKKGDINKEKPNWIEISWKTSGADEVRLYKNNFELKGRFQLTNGKFGWPLSMDSGFSSQQKNDATYELVAENKFGKISKKIHSSVSNREALSKSLHPEILDFRILPKNINVGDEIRFYWQVKNAYKVHLYDSFGEIKSVIKLPKGNYGWPLTMNANYVEQLNKSENYTLVAIGKNDSVSKKIEVLVRGKKCKLIVSVTGKYSKNTDGVGVYRKTQNNSNKFLFKSSFNKNRKNDQLSYNSIIELTPGNYYLAPIGGGKDNHGNFGVLYKPRSLNYKCSDGTIKNIRFRAEKAEY